MLRVMILTKRKIAAVCAFLACSILAVGIMLQKPSMETVACEKLLPVYSVDTNEKKVCLTFDVAWGNEDVDEILNVLKKYDVKATFFIVGEWVEKYPNDVKKIHGAGHSVQNHSDTHPHMSKLSAGETAAEIRKCNEKIKNTIGASPILFRPPYGEYNNDVITAAGNEKMQTVQWDVDSLDWKNPAPEEIRKRILKSVQNGSIILLHVGAKNTAASLPGIIEDLKNQGYSFAAVNEIIYPNNNIDSNGRQHKS